LSERWPNTNAGLTPTPSLPSLYKPETVDQVADAAGVGGEIDALTPRTGIGLHAPRAGVAGA
jgi:hypothetical protein